MVGSCSSVGSKGARLEIRTHGFERAASELDGLVRRVLVFLGAGAQVTSDDIHVLLFDDFTAALAGGSLWP